MLSQLEQLAEDAGALHSRLILLVGPRGSGKTASLRSFAECRALAVLRLGSELGRRLHALPTRHRARSAGAEFRSLFQGRTGDEFLLLDNLEVLFDATLALNPLELLRGQARTWTVIAVWPGEMREGRLVYADPGHPEHRSYPSRGLVTLPIQ